MLPTIKECSNIYTMLDDFFGKDSWEESEYSEMHHSDGDYEAELAYVFIEQKEKQKIFPNRCNYNSIGTNMCGIICNDFAVVGFRQNTHEYTGLSNIQIQNLSKLFGEKVWKILKEFLGKIYYSRFKSPDCAISSVNTKHHIAHVIWNIFVQDMY